jgi:putative flippase GtrA
MSINKKLFLKYAVFALLASLVNLGSQALVLSYVAGELVILVALAVGTGLGIGLKFVLDKKYIFYHKHVTLAADALVFGKYLLTGALTTGVFWGTELFFYYFFSDQMMVYVGGAIGLTMGYMIKYQCDKRYVFTL